MARVRRILCPVDFFPASEAALAYAVLLASSYGAKLHIVHVIPPVTLFLSSAHETGILVKAAHDESEVRLAKLKKDVESSGVQATAEIRFGEIDHQILEAIDESKADLAVAGTHGRRGFEHWLIGSVCERLLRTAPIPILTVGPAKGRTAVPKLKQILIGLDLSDDAEAASWGLSIAAACKAAATLLHVVDFAAGDIPSRYRRSLLEGVRVEMTMSIPAALKSGEVATSVDFGIPYRRILEAAKRGKTDLIVLGAHGKSRLHRALLGSNAEKIVRGATCPVLTVPA